MTPPRRLVPTLVSISLGFTPAPDEPASLLVDVPGAWPGSSDVCLFGEFDLLRPEQPSISQRGMSSRTNPERSRTCPQEERNFPSDRQLVRQDGWQVAIFGGRNRPSLLMVAHQLANASEVTSS